MKTTEVIKVTTGEILIFKNLTPKEAVRNAFIREMAMGMEDLRKACGAASQNLVKQDGNLVYAGDYVSLDPNLN